MGKQNHAEPRSLALLTEVDADDLLEVYDFLVSAEVVEGPFGFREIVSQPWPELLHKVKPPIWEMLDPVEDRHILRSVLSPEELKEELSLKGDAAVAAIRDESRRKFEKLGLARMRHAFKQGITDSQGIANRAESVEAEAWIQEEEARQQRRKWGHLWLLIGVVALLIAGAAVMVRDWMKAPP